MNNYTQLDDKLGEVDNFRVWKYRTSVILEEIDLDQYFVQVYRVLPKDRTL